MAKSLNLSARASTPSTGALTIIGSNNLPEMKVIKKVTVPTLRHNIDGQIVVFTVTGPMVESKKDIKQSDGTIGKRAIIMPVIDLNNGNDAMYVVPAIFGSELTDGYPNDSYIGKTFACQKLPKRDGKRYRDLNIVEIDGADYAEKRKAQVEEANANAAKAVNS